MSLLLDEYLIQKILLTHDPDGRRIDSELLLRAVENVICCTAPEITGQLSLQDYNPQVDGTNGRNPDGIRWEESTGYTLYEIQHQILHRCSQNQDLHTQAMFLFEMLEHFGWDAKVALVLAACCISYGKFWLMIQCQPHKPLAALIAELKNLPGNLSMYRKELKALTLLIQIMMEVTSTIISLESLPLVPELLESETLTGTKATIYTTAYWVFRSFVLCSSLIAGLRTIRLDQNSPPRIIATVTFSNLFGKLNGLLRDLKEHQNICCQQIETRLYEKLLNLFKKTHVDNQEVLRVLFALKDDFPFKKSLSLEKCGINELQNKVVILLISKPELPTEKIFFLVQQMYDHSDRKKHDDKYEIIWVPISCSQTWNQEDEMRYEFLTNSLPCFSIRQPWSLNQTVISYTKKEWNFKEEPIMVVLDVDGTITNSNATDIVWIWGAKAFPFSTSREIDLWKQESLLELIVDGISPFLTRWVEEGTNICIYGSDNLDWIREFNVAGKEIKAAGIQLEMIYVGWTNPGENIKYIGDIIDQEELSISLSFTKICFFWLRLESIKNSICRLKQAAGCETIVEEVSELLDIHTDDNCWVIMGSSSGVVNLPRNKHRQCFDCLLLWAEDVAKMGLASAVRNALELPLLDTPCQESHSVPYEVGLTERVIICSKCRSPMRTSVVYKCNGAD